MAGVQLDNQAVRPLFPAILQCHSTPAHPALKFTLEQTKSESQNILRFELLEALMQTVTLRVDATWVMRLLDLMDQIMPDGPPEELDIRWTCTPSAALATVCLQQPKAASQSPFHTLPNASSAPSSAYPPNPSPFSRHMIHQEDP